MRDPSYIENLLSICSADGIDLLIPTIDTDLLVLSQNKDRFESIGTMVMVSEPDVVRICRDKSVTARFFMDCGLQTPALVNDWKDYQGGYPAFIKPKDGSSSINAFRVKNEEELKVYAGIVNNYIVQPFIEGREYTIDIFCDWDGIPLSIVPRERLQVRTGEVTKTRIDMDPVMIEETTAICKALKPCGPLTVQLIRERQTNTDYFIEINPRYGGGAPLSMKAGARSAEAVLKLADKETPAPMNDISDGAVYSRFDQSVCITEGKKGIKGVIFDLDDTLYNEKEYVRSGFRAVSEYLGGGYEDELWTYFSEGRPAIDALLERLGRTEEKSEALTVYRAHKPQIHMLGGAREVLAWLKAEGKKIGIVTDGRPEGQWNKIKALGLDAYADDVIVTDELGGPQFRKPCDIAFRILQTRWRLPESEILFIGDNPKKDFQAPQQLGIKVLWFKNPDGLYTAAEESRTWNHAAAFSEIASLLQEGRV